jgi:hypothetical protein
VGSQIWLNHTTDDCQFSNIAKFRKKERKRKKKKKKTLALTFMHAL